jgi:homoserine kinase
MFRITVPATTANIGPGFDAMGLALNLFLSVDVRALDSDEQRVVWADPKMEPLSDDKNLILISMTTTLRKFNMENQGFELIMRDCQIPVSRGLGSSASAIVAGIIAANELAGRQMTQKDIIDWATELEGHPDNVVPAILGGMSVSFQADGDVFTTQIPVPSQLGFAVMIPDFELSTKMAREALPDSYSKADCIHNLSRAAYLVGSFNNGSLSGLREALNDKVHQPYRIGLIQDGQHILDKTKELGAAGEFISGAGPTLIALYDKSNKDFRSLLKSELDELTNNWTLLDLDVCRQGVTVEVI